MRIRAAVFIFGAVVLLGALGTAYRVSNTLTVLDRVERQRDQWQRAGEVIRALGLKDDSVVMDLGSGAGYFSLRLSPVVTRGRVVAVDVRQDSLFFLRLRALLSGRRNITVVRGRAEDDHAAAGTLQAVLIANTFHEFADPAAVLAQARRSLAPGGRVAILDHLECGTGHHHASPEMVRGLLIHSEFFVVSEDRAFIEGHGEKWFLIVAKPHRSL